MIVLKIHMWRLKMWRIPYQNVLFVLISIFKLLRKKAREKKKSYFSKLTGWCKKGHKQWTWPITPCSRLCIVPAQPSIPDPSARRISPLLLYRQLSLATAFSGFATGSPLMTFIWRQHITHIRLNALVPEVHGFKTYPSAIVKNIHHWRRTGGVYKWTVFKMKHKTETPGTGILSEILDIFMISKMRSAQFPSINIQIRPCVWNDL